MSSESESPESHEVEFEHYMTRETALEHIETFVEEFSNEGEVSITIGDETVEFEPPEHLEFEFEYEEVGDEREIEIELEWTVQEDDLEIDSS